MLDERLQLAADLYMPCSLGADIGTDHGLLPCRLLEQGVCRRMILSDVSPKALAHAEAEVRRRGLAGRARLVCADGLDALTEPCGCISITGMGGRTIAGMLRSGSERLRGAALILSAHTEQSFVRQTLQNIGYRIDREEPCLCGGHAYIVWRALPGSMSLNPMALRYGDLLFRSSSPMLAPFVENRIRMLRERLEGLRGARNPDQTAIEDTLAGIAYYQNRMENAHHEDF